MSGTPLKASLLHPYLKRIKFGDFDVSCAAPNPFQDGFVFGSDAGKLRFTDELGNHTGSMEGSRSGEAINGIASIGRTLALSTRQEVTLYKLHADQPIRAEVFVAPHGAHGITATPSGFYVAPLGGTGIMFMKAEAGEGDSVEALTTENENPYFYRIQVQRGRLDHDLLICAARQRGIGIAEVRWEDKSCNMHMTTFPELDVVDVCAVKDATDKTALAAVSQDGSLILAPNMLHGASPLTIKFEAIQGRAYRLLSAQGHLFLLTSQALYGLMNLGTRLLTGLPSVKFTTPIFVVPLEAVDATLVDSRWLLVVMPDEVYRFDLDLFHHETANGMDDGEIREETGKTVEKQYECEDIRTERRHRLPFSAWQTVSL